MMTVIRVKEVDNVAVAVRDIAAGEQPLPGLTRSEERRVGKECRG